MAMTANHQTSFPYINALQINDCFAYQDLHVTVNADDDVPFKHLILTGKNGSGKTTTLNFLYENLKRIVFQNIDIADKIQRNKNALSSGVSHSLATKTLWEEEIKKLNSVFPNFNHSVDFFTKTKRTDVLLTQFSAARTTKLSEVKTASRNNDIAKTLNSNKTEDFRKNLKQYLVNKKVSQAFAQLNHDKMLVNSIAYFFEAFEKVLRQIFEEETLHLVFEDKSFEFFILLKNNKKITFNEFSDGFSAFFNIILDLLSRVDIIREQLNDNTYQPCGFVLIDEPETHLHLELQEQVMPILTTLFPNLQFIVATHSPAVISSIKNATVYDLSTQN